MSPKESNRERNALDALIAASLVLPLNEECEDYQRWQVVTSMKGPPRPASGVKASANDVVRRMIVAADSCGYAPSDAGLDLSEIVDPTAIPGLLVHSDQPSERALTNILIGIRESFGFEAGLIYIADYPTRTLRCSAYIDSEEVLTDYRTFSYGFDETSAASKVFREKAGYFSVDPLCDPAFNRSGLKGFRVTGPVLGVPLMIGTRIVGVLIVWSRHGRPPAAHHIDELRVSACVAAGAISQLEIKGYRDYRAQTLQTFQHVGAKKLGDFFDKEYLVTLLLGILQSSFERARVFKYNRDVQTFYCLGSLGVEKDWESMGAELCVRNNPYARDVEETFLSNSSARVYTPSPATGFGADPDAQTFGTPPHLPWAVVPLIVDGELFGQIVADNALSGRQISRESLDHLGVLAGLVSQGISKAKHAKALADVKSFYCSLAEVLPKCILRKDLNGKFVYVNQHFCDRLGKSKKEIIGKSDDDLYSTQLAEKFRHDDKLVIRTGAALERIEENVQPGGAKVLVRVFKAPVRDSTNQIVGVHCIFWDVTKERRAEEELLQVPPMSRERGGLMPGRYRNIPQSIPTGS